MRSAPRRPSLRSGKILLLFDEVEDVFNQPFEFFPRPSADQSRKGWINHCLERNPVPAFWITNSIDNIDEAFIRRFDLSIEVPSATAQ